MSILRNGTKVLLVFTCILSTCMLFACRKSKHLFEVKNLSYSQKIFAASERDFLPHLGPGQWDSYLTMDIPFAPVLSIFEQLEESLNVRLRHRGEAHITVITPVEYWNQLKPFISMQDINALALEMNLQKSQFDIQCLGSGQKWFFPWHVEETFFIVIKSPDLMTFRHKVKELFVQKGGSSSAFNPEHYFPHITIGFTRRDLHESDGVIKGINSCDSRLKLNQRI